MNNAKINILILGGTKCIGRSLVYKLASNQNFNIHIINRMNRYWDDGISNLPNIIWTYADRNKHTEFTKYLKYYSKKHGFSIETGQKWDLVIDFCAYERKDVKSIIESLSNLVRLYVFLSSDSVYEVSDPKMKNYDKQNRLVESSCCRPQAENIINNFAKEDSFGHNKLSCEEYLFTHCKNWEIPYVIQRLPDVIGPYDRTYSLWTYIKWLEFSDKYPIHVDKDSSTKKFSLVYSEDVVDILFKFCLKFQNSSCDEIDQFVKSLAGNAFNLCCSAGVTFLQLIQMISQKMDIKQVKFVHESDLCTTGKFFQPNAECGYLSNEKAANSLGFTPTDLEYAINNSVEFFQDADKKSSFIKEQRECVKKFTEVVAFYTNNKGYAVLKNNKIEIVMQNYPNQSSLV